MGGYYNNAADTGKDLLVRERDYMIMLFLLLMELRSRI